MNNMKKYFEDVIYGYESNLWSAVELKNQA